jgi:iron complex outermembrane recepter protein
MTIPFNRKSLPLAVFMTTGLLAQSAAAQLEEVLVTAQKRSESLQDIPIAVSAYNAEAIESMGLLNAQDVGLASPSVQMPSYPLSNNNLALFIRGIGNTDSVVLTKDPTVGVYYDGVYAARSTGLLADLSDLERVEILRGPQGTLYGRNTTAGAINFINAKPTGELGFKQTLGIGNYDSWRSISHLNLPDMAGFKAKLTASFSDRDGWVTNDGANAIPGLDYEDYYQKETEGYRIALRYDGIEKLLVDYSYDYSDVTSTPGYFQYVGPTGGLTAAGAPITDSFQNRLKKTRAPVGGDEKAYYLPGTETEVEGHNLTISYEINPNLELRSVTGYREFDDDLSQNFSDSFGGASTFEVHAQTEHEQFSQELQLIGSHERLQWVAGLYYFEEEGTQQEEQYLDRALVDSTGILAIDLITGFPCSDGRNGAPFCTDFAAVYPVYLGQYTVDTDIESWSAFGQATWTPDMLDDRLDLTLGLRYTDDQRSAERTWDAWVFNAFSPGESESDLDNVDHNLVADYSWTDDVSTYLKWSTGFRSGGSSRNGLDFSKPFEDESVESFELGVKSELWDNRIRVNAAVFHMVVEDIILDYLPDPVNAPALVEVFNSGDAEIDGLEIDFQIALTEDFLIGANYAYLDWDIKDAIFPDGSDRTDTTVLAWAPEHAYALTADYNVALGSGYLRIHLDYSWQDEQFALSNTNFGEVLVDDFGSLNGRISLADMEVAGGIWQLAMWGKNMTDEDSGNYSIGATASTFMQPSTYGVEVIFEY